MSEKIITASARSVGADSDLKDEVVIVGGRLDSWIGSMGATADGAGAVGALKATIIPEASSTSSLSQFCRLGI